LIFWTALRGSQNSSVALSQVMNHGFWTTTPRQNAKSGVAHCKLSPSQESENEQIQKQIDAFFLTVRGSSTRNLCYQHKLSIKLFIGKSLKDSRVRPGIARTWMLHHDSAPCHTAVSINEFLAEKSIPAILQPPYSPDLSPCDFFLFPRLKNHLKGRHFGTSDNIQKSVTEELEGIPAEAFQHCCEQWKQRLRRCVAAQGNYFEGDNLDL